MPQLDDLTLFTGEMNGIAQKKYAASTIGYGADTFSAQIYQEYIADGSPHDRKKWITQRLAESFVYMVEKPKWKGEPTWPYYHGEPMVFLHQFQIPLSAKLQLKGRFPMGETIYVFGSKNPPNPQDGEAWSVVYKLIAHDYTGDFVHVEHLDSLESL